MSIRLVSGDYQWNDTMVPPTTQRIGAVAPTLNTGFMGNAAFQKLDFVDNQADEVQFVVQFPHNIAYNSILKPHVHFTLDSVEADGDYTIEFVMEYYWADIGEAFSVNGIQTYTMTKDIKITSEDQAWVHFMAVGASDITMGKGISSIMVCRLYRDNTPETGTNYPGNVSMLGFDIHYQIDSLGSEEEATKEHA